MRLKYLLIGIIVGFVLTSVVFNPVKTLITVAKHSFYMGCVVGGGTNCIHNAKVFILGLLKYIGGL